MRIISGALCYSGHYVRLGICSYHDLNERAGRLYIGLLPFSMTFMIAAFLVKTSGISNMQHFNAEIKLFYGKIKYIRQILLFHAEYFNFHL